MAFLIPYPSNCRTSARPSTTMMASLDSTRGPAGWSAYSVISAVRACLRTVSTSASSVIAVASKARNSSVARSTTWRRFAARTSSISVTRHSARQGPTRSIVSNEAASTAVSTRSIADATVNVPTDCPSAESISTSMRPTRSDSWSVRRSSSSPNSPSVCPNTAPTTSLRSTTPLVCICAWMRYFSECCIDDLPCNGR